jgi:putative ABC transport system permease protein
MMSPIRRIWNVIRRRRLDEELRQEVDTHLALIEEEERANGANDGRAHRDARVRFGSPLGHRERALDGVMATWLEDAVREVGFAARRLWRSPAFTLAAVLTLALAIGANTSIFAVVQRVLLNPLAYGDSSRLIALDYGVPIANISRGINFMTWQLYYQLADHAKTLEGVAVYDTGEATLTGRGEAERIQISHATPSLVPVLRVVPTLGRWFAEQEGVPGNPPVAVLSHGLWVRHYGGDPGVVGQVLTLDGVPTTVIGVMPAGFAFPNARIDLWTAAQSTRATASFLFVVAGVARLRDGATIDSTRAEMTALIADLARRSPNQTGLVSTALPLQDAIVGRVASALWIVLASVALVLLIACANVANLFLVRSEARQREVAVRRALGAGRMGIARYFMAESLILSLAGAAVGVGLAWAASHLLVAVGPSSLPRLEEVRLDGVVLTFALALGLLTAFSFGAIPLARVAPLQPSLHEAGRANSASRERHRLRQVLMGGQIALSLMLVVSSGLMLRSFQKLRAVDPGFSAASALTFRIGLPNRGYSSRVAGVATHRAILDRLSALPGVTAVSASTCLPLRTRCFGNSLLVEGRIITPGKLPTIAWFNAVAGGYVEALGMHLLRGRTIDRFDVDRNRPVVVVNKALADTFFPSQDPIGKRIQSSTPRNSRFTRPDWMEIVGVVSNTPGAGLAEPSPGMQLYMPMSIAGGPDIPAQALVGPSIEAMSYVVRTATSPSQSVAAVRAAVAEIDPHLALAEVQTLQDILDGGAAQMAFTMVLIVIAATVALLLGVIGIYGVMSYIVSQRTSEIGVRLALGAEPRSVAAMILRQGSTVALAGAAVGLAAALAGSRLIASLLYGIGPRDPAVFAGTTLLLLIVAALACWLPARRAARLSPLEALRVE